MLFLTPRHVSQARVYLREASKILAYRKDVAPPEAVQEVQAAINSLRAALPSESKDAILEKMTALDQACGKLHPPVRDSSWRENVEVFIVAITVALGVRTYFVQPFTIPTGSMQPTLNGIIPEKTETPPPALPKRIWDFFAFGRTHFNVVAQRNETIQSVEERHYFGIPLGLFTHTVVNTTEGQYSVSAALNAIRQDSRCTPGRTVKPGDIIARGYSDTGDHVLVDKFSYHFRAPRRADVFVFNTANIMTRDNVFRPPGSPSQFYIKRLAGTPGDHLQIKPPQLFINGSLASDPPFQRVMAGTLERPVLGYQGYSNAPENSSFRYLNSPKATFEVPPKAYFALGDNSYHSSDSRDWGIVPERNVTGRALMVYWPLGKHWGQIH